MKPSVSPGQFHKALAHDLFPQPPTLEEAFCLMLLLHACPLRLNGQAQVKGQAQGFTEITTRHAAEVAASLFPQGEESYAAYWYWHCWSQDKSIYAVIENPPDELIPVLKQIRQKIDSHPWVDQLVDEDWDLLSKLE
ncbi:MAG: hypothetical protein KDA70_06755 [Planctomycetaceae bacterium]|nr:hypothetical protein [Planctomycetaceae bacterium]